MVWTRSLWPGVYTVTAGHGSPEAANQINGWTLLNLIASYRGLQRSSAMAHDKEAWNGATFDQGTS